MRVTFHMVENRPNVPVLETAKNDSTVAFGKRVSTRAPKQNAPAILPARFAGISALDVLPAALCPFWWPSGRPSLVRIPAREFDLGISADEWARIRGDCAAAELRKDGGAGNADVTKGSEAAGAESTNDDPQTADDLAARRAKVAEHLRAGAKDFFAMKSTGAEIIVPIFGAVDVEEAMAA